MKIAKKSPITGKVNTMDLDVTKEELTKWQLGDLIQHVTPRLTPTEREFLITGMTPEEQEEFYNNLEE